MEQFALAPLPGGYSGETFVADAAGERTIVRIYSRRGAERGSAAAETDAAVLRLVRGLLPIPEVLDVRPSDPLAGVPAVLVTSFLPGRRLDLLLPDLDDAGRRDVGRSLGRIIARLSQMPMPRPGRFVDGELAIALWPEGTDIVDFVEHQHVSSALASWPLELFERLLAVAQAAQDLLDPIDRVCLVHGDFNSKNLLIDPHTHEITGLLDWEFAHAGMPFADLGNLLRFDRHPAFVQGAVDGYLQVAGHLDGLTGDGRRGRLLDLARAADLLAVVELAGRAGQNPVADRADAQLRAIVLAGDLHATSDG